MAYTAEDYSTKETNVWCPGCGDFGILQAVKMAMVELQLEPTQTIVVSGIGCSSQMPHWLNVNGFHGIHGRALPVATGIHLTNPELKVLVHGGDGDGYGIGMGHLIHTMRRNVDLTYVVHDNQIYGLTKGQASPTSTKGHVTASTPAGNPDNPVHPIQLAISSGATFVARSSSANLPHLKETLVRALNHRGFSLVDVMQPCITFNKVNTYAWLKEVSYIMDETEYDRTDTIKAFEKSLEWDEKVPLGVFYQEKKPTLLDDMNRTDQPAVLKNDQPDIEKVLANFY